jgi:hypothetical protein
VLESVKTLSTNKIRLLVDNINETNINNMNENLKIIRDLLKKEYKFNEETDCFDKYFQTVSDDIFFLLKPENYDE